jgi:hypothetical protein
MSKQEYALGLPEASQVRVFGHENQEQGGDWDNLVVCLDQTIIGRIATRQELVAGRVFTLPDSSVLKVQLCAGQLEARRNGDVLAPLVVPSEKRSHPALTPSGNIQLRWRLAYCTTFFIAGLNILLGLLLTQQENQASVYPPSNTPLILGLVIGGLFLILGIFAARKSEGALEAAIVFYLIDGLIALFQLNVLGILVHVILISLMISGAKALHRIREIEHRASFR